MSQPAPEGMWGDTGYLDAVSALEGVQRYKHRTFALLDPQPGAQLLDVGCGPGDDALALAEQIGQTGRVVGIDVREHMIAQARARSAGRNLPVDFRIGDIYQLEFADGTFDGCRADRVFQHLERPQEALAEMVRVTRTSGRIVVYDVDWETLIIDTPYQAVTRKIVNYECDIHANGWAGRSLLRLLRSGGLQKIAVEPLAGIITDFDPANGVFGFQEMAEEVQAAGGITADQAHQWMESLEQAGREEQFFSAITGFIVCGQKP
jgi:ubiquinone/menaquinone biosynthesis C-methylase UbiE